MMRRLFAISENRAKFFVLSIIVFSLQYDLLRVWFDHNVAVGEDGEDDRVVEELTCDDVNGDTTNRVERSEDEEGRPRREAVDEAALGQDDERPFVQVEGVYVDDGRGGELLG